jgi:hypothetical protein
MAEPARMTFVRAGLLVLAKFGGAIFGAVSGSAAAQDGLSGRERPVGDWGGRGKFRHLSAAFSPETYSPHSADSLRRSR